MNALLRAGRKRWPRARWLFRYEVLAVLVIVAFYGVENLRGHLAWRAAVARAEADGLPMEIEVYLPPEAPEGEVPFLESSAWETVFANDLRLDTIAGLDIDGDRHPSTGLPDLVTFLNDPEPGLSGDAAAIRVLGKLNSRRWAAKEFAKKVRQPIFRRSYDYSETAELLDSAHHDIEALKYVADYHSLRAKCHLAVMNSRLALQDFQTLQYLAAQIEGGGTLIEVTLGTAIRLGSQHIVRDGLVRGTWETEHLLEIRESIRFDSIRLTVDDALDLEQTLGAKSLANTRKYGTSSDYKVSFVPSVFWSLPLPNRFESLYEKSLTTFVPDGWLKMNAAHILESTRLHWMPREDLTIPERKRLMAYEEGSDSVYELYVMGREPYLEGMTRFEARTRLLLVLIAADLHQRETGEWPTSLDSLGSVDPEIELRDPFSPENDLHYHFDRSKSEIRVWSVGEDRIDDGGDDSHRKLDVVLTLPNQ